MKGVGSSEDCDFGYVFRNVVDIGCFFEVRVFFEVVLDFVGDDGDVRLEGLSG